MSIPEDKIDKLRAFSYTEVEARFLDGVALRLRNAMSADFQRDTDIRVPHLGLHHGYGSRA